jgi:hypothetical protein
MVARPLNKCEITVLIFALCVVLLFVMWLGFIMWMNLPSLLVWMNLLPLPVYYRCG